MLRSLFLIGSGIAFLTFGGRELAHHALAIRQMKDVTAPLVAEIPGLEQRAEVLKKQAELSTYQASLRTGSQAEYVDVYLLPNETNLEATLRLFEALGAKLQSEGKLRQMSSVSFGALQDRGNYSVQSLAVAMELKEQGLKDLLLFIRLAGIRTVGDLLSGQDRATLMTLSEQESPAGVIVLGEFFAQDLLKYVRDEDVRRLADEKVLQALGSESFVQAFNTTIAGPLFVDTTRLLQGPLGDLLLSQKLWPMQFMTLDNLVLSHEQNGAWFDADLTVLLHTR